MNTYHNFDLVADAVEYDEAGRVRMFRVRVLDSPVGQAERAETVKLPSSLWDQLDALERRSLDAHPDEQVALGRVLGALILPPYARRMFERSLDRIDDADGLRLRLRLDNALSDYPWEFAYLGSSSGDLNQRGFLTLNPRTSIVRHQDVALPAGTGSALRPADGFWWRCPRLTVNLGSSIYRPNSVS